MTDILFQIEQVRPPIKFAYFDLGGVVFSFSGGLEAFAKKVHSSLEEVTAYWMSQDDAICRGELDPQQFWNNLASQFGFNDTDLDFLGFWISHFRPIRKTHEAMKSLQTHGIKVGILANIYPKVFEKALYVGAIPKLNYYSIIKSCDLGIVKPDLQIFEHALSQTGLHPNEVILIDDRAENIRVANRLKWNTVLFE